MVDGGKRRDAIAAALAASGPDDIVAVLGKGHERGQEVAGQVLPFADEDAIRDVWAELHGAEPPTREFAWPHHRAVGIEGQPMIPVTVRELAALLGRRAYAVPTPHPRTPGSTWW